MARHALLLRGVNVGKDNVLRMADLEALLEEVGCTEVTTLLQSGNAVLATELAAPKLARAVEEALARHMGRPIAITLRSEAELRAVVSGNPMPEHTSEPSRLCVTFLSHPPSEAELAPLRARDFAPEAFVARGRELYTWHPNGQGKSPLAAALAKLRVRGTVTTRNWSTVQKLLALLLAT